MRSLIASLFALVGIAAALPADTSVERRADAFNPPRNLVYVQTFRTVAGGQLSLLSLIQNPTKVTHVYLSSLHINSDPNAITLNDNNPNASIWDQTWSEVAQLQASGVKVMFMMGGAA